MAAGLSTPTLLHVGGPYVSVTEGEREGEALITLKRSFEVFNIHDNRCVHSWPLASGDQLTCSAVYHSSAGSYCAVRNKNELLLWKSEEKTLPSSHLTLPSSPLSLLSTSHPDHLISVCSTGSVVMVTVEGGGGVRVLSEVVLGGRKLRGKGISVVGCDLVEVGGCESVVVTCAAGEVFVIRIDQSDLVLAASLNLGSKVVRESVCVCGDELLVAESDGIVSVHSLTSSSSSSRSLSTTGSTPNHTHYKLTSVSSNQFVIANDVGRVSLRDSVYGTLQHTIESDLDHLATVWCVWGYIVMCGEEGSVKVSRVTGVGGGSLAAALGRKTTPPLEAVGTWGKTGKHWRLEVAESKDELKVLARLCDPQQTPSLDLVVALFPHTLSLPPPSYWPLVRRLLSEKRFWAREQLAELVKTGAVGGSEVADLVERALEVNDWSLLNMVITCSHNIPEPTLVSLLHHTLELPEEVESGGDRLKRDKLLWGVLGLPYSDPLLQHPLSRLPLSSVLSLLQFLTPHISVVSLSRPPPLPYPRLLDWLAIILDTHWPALSLSPSAKQLLHNFKHTTYHQMLICENLATVKNMLEASKKRKTKSSASAIRDRPVTIERLKLKI